MMRIAAVIPARGGSIGLPGKNIKPLNGVPLIGRTILAAKQSRYSLDVYVSSDSPEILQAAGQFGAIAIERPLVLAGSTASSESALIHALQVLAQCGTPVVVLVFLQCTSPFTSAVHLDAPCHFPPTLAVGQSSASLLVGITFVLTCFFRCSPFY